MGEFMSVPCPECDRLWREYADALITSLKIASDRQIAEIHQNSAALAKLDPLYHELIRRRGLAREAINDHGRTHGNGVAAAL
jgi:hypothetical protein